MAIDHKLEIARGGRFRDVGINANNAVLFLPLCEREDDRAANIVQPVPGRRVNDGTWEGTFTQRGVQLTSIPSGELGARGGIGARVRVPNDGPGFEVPGESADRNLSLAGGDGYVYAVYSPHADDLDGTVRAIAQKMGDLGDDGYFIGVEGTQARARLEVANVIICDLAGGTLVPGEEYTIYWHLDVSTGIARLDVNGVTVDTVTGIVTEPDFTSADFLTHGFESGGDIVGVIGLVGVVRDGSDDISAELEATKEWTDDLIDHTRGAVAPLVARRGSRATDPKALMAEPMTLQFALSNDESDIYNREQGQFTPGHANCLSNFEEGIPIRWRASRDNWATSSIFFWGFVEKIRVEPGVDWSQHVNITAASWMAQAMDSELRPVPIQTNIRSDRATGWLIDQAKRPPIAIDFHVGTSTFAYWGDDISRSSIMAEQAVIGLSEGGHTYEKGDGTLVFESQEWRYVNPATPREWDETVLLPGTEAERDIGAIINVIPLTWHPRQVGSSGQVLVTMAAYVPIPAGRYIELELEYRDPDQQAAPIGAAIIDTPVATTDYQMFENADGSGANLTAFASVSIAAREQGGASSIVRVKNTGTADGYFKTRLLGTPLRAFHPVSMEVRDDASVRRYDAKRLPLDLKYEGDPDRAQTYANRWIAIYKLPFMAARMAVLSDTDADLEEELLEAELGDPVVITETMTALDDTVRFFIQGIEIALDVQGVLTGRYTLIPGVAADAFEVLDEVGHAELDSFMIA